MKDEIIILIRKWFKSKTGIDLIHDPSLISLVNEIETLRIHDVVGQGEQLCPHENIGAANAVKMYCMDCKKWVDNE